MSQALQITVLFFVNLIFDLLGMIVLLRLLLQWLNANPQNQIYQQILRFTNPIVLPLRQFLPTIQRIDTAVLSLFLMIIFVKLLISLPLQGIPFHLVSFILLMLAEIINQVLNLLFFAVLLVAIISWLSPHFYNPVVEILYLLTDPLLSRARRFIPPISGFDLSPLLVLIAIKLINLFLVSILYSLAH